MRAMRAAVFTQPGRALDIVEGIEIDDPRPGEVLVRIRHCGVCHSDLSIIDGALPFPVPAILGHEASGTIAALGSGVTELAEGTRVVLSMRPPCGHCYWCVRNEPVLCAETAGLPGSGLGLSIVQLLTEMHGGHVSVHSVLGAGTTFSVFLPIRGLPAGTEAQ